MEHNEFYVYPGTYFTCGGCGSSMSPVHFNLRPYRPKVACGNRDCPKYRHILVIGDEHRIPAFDTGEMVPEPGVAMQAGTTGGGVVGTGVGNGRTVAGGTLGYDPATRTIVTEPPRP